MIDDKLTQDERRRLEALSQAVIFTSGRHNSTETVNIASTFERFIRTGEK